MTTNGSSSDLPPFDDPLEAVDRRLLVRQLVAGILQASLTPVDRKRLLAEVEQHCAREWCEVATHEIDSAVADLEDDAVVRFDGLGRLYAVARPTGLVDCLPHMKAAAAAAVQLADASPPPEARSDFVYPAPPSVLRTPLLSASAEQRVAKQVVRGDPRAKKHLISANTRLVASLVRSHRYLVTTSFDQTDLFQEGCLGLIRAAEKFDPSRGFKFSTYATWWIKQAFARGAGDKSRTVRLPVHLVEKLTRIRAAESELDRDPSAESTPARLAERAGIELDELQAITRANRPPEPLHASDAWANLEDFDFGPHEQVEVLLEQEALERLLAQHLSEREIRVLRLRYGLGDEEPHTLDAVGRELGLTRERVRQIQDQAQKKLEGAPWSA